MANQDHAAAPMDLQALAQAIRDLTPAASPAAVTAVSLKLPAFWSNDPEVWFAQVEAQFQTRNPAITADQTKFDYTVAALDPTAAKEVRSIILQPPESGCRYDTIKAALIAAFGTSQAAKDAELLNMSGLGDQTPTGLLRHMRSLNADPATLFKAVWLAQLPMEARRVLAASPTTDLDVLAKQADAIVEISRIHNSRAMVAAAQSSVQVKARMVTETCFYHVKFGQDARKCRGGNCPMQHLVEKTVPTPVSGNAVAGR